MAPQSGARRALRDLVPATLVTGAAGLVVALVVGGTASELRRAFVDDGAREVAGSAGFTPATPVLPSADGVTVQVRPGRPDPLDAVSLLDALLPPAPSRSEGVATVVAGVVVRRPAAVPAAFPSAGAPVVEPAVVPPPAPPPAPPTVREVAAPSPPAGSTDPKAKGKPARRRTASSVSTTSTETVAFADDGSDDGKQDKDEKAGKDDKDDKDDRGGRDRQPSSDRVPPHGRRSR